MVGSAAIKQGRSANRKHTYFFFGLKTSEDDSGSPNLASATKDQKISANPMPQGLS